MLFLILMENLFRVFNKTEEHRAGLCSPSRALLFLSEKEALFSCGALAKPKNQQFSGRQIKPGRESFDNSRFCF